MILSGPIEKQEKVDSSLELAMVNTELKLSTLIGGVQPNWYTLELQWNLRRKDTLGTALLSFLQRLSFSRRFMKYLLYNIVG